MENVLLTIEYDGTNFAGWQKQPHQRTVQGELEQALSAVCGTDIKINGTSRTDAGVHALGQRANFKADFEIPVERIKLATNNYLSKKINVIGGISDVRITSVSGVPLDFHARFCAKAKTYIYKIRNAREPDPFLRNFCYQITKPLDLTAMKKGAEAIEGTHDFKCFQAQGGKIIENTVRTIYELKLYEELLPTLPNQEIENKLGKVEKNEIFHDKLITMVVTGDGFLYNMVRIIAGTIVDIGKSRINHREVREIIEGKNRQKAGHTAPPQGLYLNEVYY